MNALTLALTAGGTATAICLAGILWLPFALAGRPRGPGLLWTAAPVAGVLFLAGVFWLQVPIQAVLGQAIVQGVSPLTLGAWPILVAGPVALVAGLVQEAARLLGILAALRIARRDRALGLWTGALAGAGIGLFEAAWLLSAVPPAHFALLSEPVLERVLAVAFHIGAGALLGAGIAARRTGRAFALAVLLHTAVDSGAALYQLGRASLSVALWVTAAVGIGLFLWMLALARRRAREVPAAMNA